jgi:hypothetical protein
VSRDIEAILGREAARHNSHPYDNGKGRLASIPHANWGPRLVHLTLLGAQIVNHDGSTMAPQISRRGYASGPSA